MRENLKNAELAPLTTRTANAWVGGREVVAVAFRYRLSVEDPDDQRSLWRRAALDLGEPDEIANTALLIQIGKVWQLLVFRGDGSLQATCLSSFELDSPNRVDATLYLCGMVWGEEGAVRDPRPLIEAVSQFEGVSAKLDDIEADFKRTIEDSCAPDERHCSCVPHLRAEIKRLAGGAVTAGSKDGE